MTDKNPPTQDQIHAMLRSGGYTDWPQPNTSRSTRTVGDYQITVTRACRADRFGRLTGGRHVWFTILVDPTGDVSVIRLNTKVEARSITEPFAKGFFHDYADEAK
jgi:hypothetical protein